MNEELRAVADQMRMGAAPMLAAVPPSKLQEWGDAIVAGLEAAKLVEAIEYEIREEAAFRGVFGQGRDDPIGGSTALAWERLREDIGENRDTLADIRTALVETGSLAATDKETPLAGLITALFSF